MRNRPLYLLVTISFLMIIQLFSGLIIVSGSEGNRRVFDEANLFSELEIVHIEEVVEVLQNEIRADVVILTTNNTSGKSSRDFAGDFYDDGNFGVGRNEDGILFLIDMDNREIYLMTAGKMINFLTDDRIERILDRAFTEVSNERYLETIWTALISVSEFYYEGIPDDQYQYNSETGEVIFHRRPMSLMELVVISAISLSVGGLFYLSVSGIYLSGKGRPKFSARKNGRLDLTEKQDQFLTKTITKRLIPVYNDDDRSSGGSSRSSSSGGRRSTTHTTSSGSTRGGGGRRF